MELINWTVNFLKEAWEFFTNPGMIILYIAAAIAALTKKR